MIITREIATKVRDTVAAGLVKGVGVQEPGKMCVEAAVCYALGLPHGDDPGCVDPALRRLKIRLNDSNWPSDSARSDGLRRLALAQLGSKDVLDTRKFVRRVSEMTIRTMVPLALRAAASRNPKHADALEAAAVRCEREGTVASARAAAYNAAYAVDAVDAAYNAANAAAAVDAVDAAYNAAANAADNAAYAADNAAYAADAAAYAAYAADNAAANTAYAADNAAYAADAAAYAAANTAKSRQRVLSIFAESVVQILIEMNAPGCEFLDLVPMEAI